MSRGWPSLSELLEKAAPIQRASLERAAAKLPSRQPARPRPVKRADPGHLVLEQPNLPWHFALAGAPRTKNTGKSPRPGVVIPSEAYRRWFHEAMAQLPEIRRSCRGTCSAPINVTAVFYRDRNVGDEDRYCVALGDWLQRSGLVLNDSLIHWTGDTRREVDRACPRIVITITAG